jgi:CRP-like cAMP-binding protein
MRHLKETDKDYICDLQAPCFQTLTPEEIELIRSSKTQVLFKKGDNLTKQGTFASYVLFMVKGLAKQYIESDNGKSFNLRIIKPAEFIGLTSVFTSNTFNYSSVALTDCHVFLVEKSAILQIFPQNGVFGLGITKRYFEQNVNVYDTLRTVLYKQMNGRMAAALLYIDGLKTEYPEIFSLLSRKDLADFAGTSTESAVKLLKSFEKDGIIALNDKDISIINYQSINEINIKG